MTSAATSIVLFATWAPWAIPLGFIAMYSFPMLAARRH
jgi:hypothetical protein